MDINSAISLLLKNKEQHKILDLIEHENKHDVIREYFKWTPLVLLLISNNNPNIMAKLVYNFPKYLSENTNGLIPFHLIYEYGYIDLIKHYITEDPKTMIAVNRNNINFIGMLVINNDHELLPYAIMLSKTKKIEIHLNSTIKNGDKPDTNLLEIALENYVKNTPKDIRIVKLLLDSGFDTHKNFENESLFYVTKKIIDIEAYRLVRKYARNIDKCDQLLVYAISNGYKDRTLIKYILKTEKDLVTTAYDVACAIMYECTDIVNKILQRTNPYYITYFRTSKQSSLLTLALAYSNLDYEIYYYLIELCDINQQNSYGNSPLHVICSSYNINYFTEILSNKLLNIFAKNKDNLAPIDLINKEFLHVLLDLFIKSYKKYYNITTDDHYCLKNINKRIFDEKCIEYYNPIKELPLLEEAPTVIGYQPAFPFTTLLYYLVLNRNKDNLYMPSIGHIDDIINNTTITNNTFYCANKCINSSKEGIIDYNTLECPSICIHYLSIINLFTNFSPSNIIWESETNCLFHKDFIFYLIKALMQPQRYIVYDITIFFPKNDSNIIPSFHSNVLLFDKIKLSLERFDSNGVTAANLTNMDTIICSLFEKGLEYYYGKKVELYFEKSVSDFQSYSHNYKNSNNHGDPRGFCHTWCLWFIENRIKYPNLKLNEFINYYIEKLKINKEDSPAENIYSFIRNYTGNINKLFSDLCILAEIPIKSMYESFMPIENAKKLANIVNNLY